jgi:hypothetical protein
MTETDIPTFSYVRDRAAVVAVGIVCIVREAPNEREACARVAETLRFEFADIEREASENRLQHV